MSCHATLISVFLALSLPCRAVNQVHVVSPAGPFLDIQSAVDAAADGDLVLVRAGSYAGFAIDDKELAVVGDEGPTIFVSGEVAVRNLADSRIVLLAGFDVTGVASNGLVVEDCAGLVRIQDCRIEGSFVLCSSGGVKCSFEAVRVEGSDQVLFSACTAESYPEQPQQPNAVPGAGGIYAEASGLALYESAALGGNGGQGQSIGIGIEGDGREGGHGFRSPDAFLFSSASSFLGGDGGDGGNGMTCSFGAVPGEGGDGGDGVQIGGAGSNPEAILLDHVAQRGNGGAPGAPLICGAGAGTKGKALRVLSGTLTKLAGGSLRMSAPNVARELETVTITVTGTPGDQVQVFVATSPQWAYDPALAGVVAVQEPFVKTIALGTLPAAGMLTKTLLVPSMPASVQARTWYLQGVALPPAGAPSYLGTPLALARLDQAF